VRTEAVLCDFVVRTSLGEICNTLSSWLLARPT